MFIPEPSGSLFISCTTPFPKVFVPTNVALLLSFRAPLNISDALADPPLIMTTIGLFVIISSLAL
jgi:hypothetical protein